MPLVKNKTAEAQTPATDEKPLPAKVEKEAEAAAAVIRRTDVHGEIDPETLGKVTMHAYIAAIASPGVCAISHKPEDFDSNIEKYAQLIIKKSLGLK